MSAGHDELDSLFARIGKHPLPPLECWNPAQSGRIDIRITRDGAWHHNGSLIGRPQLVRLLSTVLRREDDDHYYLVTPVEKLRITVDDVPLLAVEFDRQGAGETQNLAFRTNVDDIVLVDREHLLWVVDDPQTGETSPYLRVRNRLDARLTRAAFYRLADLCVPRGPTRPDDVGVWSGGVFFPLGYVES